ncbi:DUF3341 domain-containing protein [Amantichitinum ursilacus]|uniref:DUF3341 domain-containing protein n=1 Tax=Amantichitinum ursilacus TaxID=857265 RepID=A0A0N0GLN4_9NEIS|nr:DUF3341 domain-containing protein [Amantichitinum ursilacus]KPC50165.1 hypothetical protein WG78_18210 [Amantichitinum ursilacus]
MSGFGYLVGLHSADALVEAVKAAKAAGFVRIDTFTPQAIEELEELLPSPNRVPLLTLLGGIVGGAAGYLMQWYSATQAYAINVGGRPLHSWPSFIPITFETTVLGAALAAVVAFLWGSGLPRLHHPLFDIDAFALASSRRFFICIRAQDPKADQAQAWLQTLGQPVYEVKQ